MNILGLISQLIGIKTLRLTNGFIQHLQHSNRGHSQFLALSLSFPNFG